MDCNLIRNLDSRCALEWLISFPIARMVTGHWTNVSVHREFVAFI